MGLVVLAYQEIGYVCLESLLTAGAAVDLVLTHSDESSEKVWFRSVAGLAEAAGRRVLRPDDVNSADVVAMIREMNPDFIFSFYYRQVLSPEILALARRGAYNVHGSLLPRYRGRAPANWVLIHGETETGLTLHRMVAKVDAGPIVAQVVVPIDESDNIATLYAKMAPAAARLMAGVWPALAAGQAKETPQDERQASYFGRRRPDDGLIDWRKPAKTIFDLCRAVTHPFPGAFTYYQGRKLYIWSADYEKTAATIEPPGLVLGPPASKGLPVACGQGRLWIRTAQWEDGPECDPPNLIALELPERIILETPKGVRS